MTPGAFRRGPDPDGRTVSLYAQLAQLLRQRVLSGEFNTGDRFPAESTLAASYGVTVSVVRRALDLLRAEGWIVTSHGIGSIVASRPERERISLRAGESTDVRMPTPAERRQLGMAEGVPVIVVIHRDGSETPYDANKYLPPV
ncbi:MAG TPA: GntR family transcriptional regulator [Streptosporangiaceae bacterium]|nr:GntR family transcriptional regulator [Streptosporangiaceae bacterium]